MSRPNPKAKRNADVYTRTHHQAPSDDLPSTKKPRFDARNPSTLAPDAPEEDDVLDLDEIGKGAGVKRNAVNIDGYDSDSDNDNFDARARQKASAQKKTEEEDANDMFADLEEPDGDEDEEDPKLGRGKKDVRFLDETEIEGQVSNSKSGGHVSADFTLNPKGKERTKDEESSSESGDDELRDELPSDVDEEIGAGGKKKHAPKLDAFNMRDEQEEGRFDETGNFVRKAMDPDALHDNWLDGVSKKDMKKAKEAQDQREREQRQKEREDDAILTSDLLATLIRNMQIGETVLESLQRLNKNKPKSKPIPKWKQKKKDKQQNGHAHGDAMDVDGNGTTEDPAETRRKEAVEAITGAADQLLTRGDLDVYDHERELLMRMYKRETGDDYVEGRRPDGENDTAADDKMWEYHWADGRDGDQIHGPYDNASMRAWDEAGYFGDGFECRPVGGRQWTAVTDF
jgi:CD2 antigen cytoplasmic tail-binding protein 2